MENSQQIRSRNVRLVSSSSSAKYCARDLRMNCCCPLGYIRRSKTTNISTWYLRRVSEENSGPFLETGKSISFHCTVSNYVFCNSWPCPLTFWPRNKWFPGLFVILVYVKFGTSLQNRSVAGGRYHAAATMNSGRSRHSDHTTAEWGGRGGVAAASAASSRTDAQWRVQTITPQRLLSININSFIRNKCRKNGKEEKKKRTNKQYVWKNRQTTLKALLPCVGKSNKYVGLPCCRTEMSAGGRLRRMLPSGESRWTMSIGVVSVVWMVVLLRMVNDEGASDNGRPIVQGLQREKEKNYLPSKRQYESSSVTITTMAGWHRRHMPINAGRL